MLVKNIDLDERNKIESDLDSMVERYYDLNEDIKVEKASFNDKHLLYKLPTEKSFVIDIDYKGCSADYVIMVENGYHSFDILIFDQNEIGYALALQNVFSEDEIEEQFVFIW